MNSCILETHKVGNNSINANFVFPWICSSKCKIRCQLVQGIKFQGCRPYCLFNFWMAQPWRSWQYCHSCDMGSSWKTREKSFQRVRDFKIDLRFKQYLRLLNRKEMVFLWYFDLNVEWRLVAIILLGLFSVDPEMDQNLPIILWPLQTACWNPTFLPLNSKFFEPILNWNFSKFPTIPLQGSQFPVWAVQPNGLKSFHLRCLINLELNLIETLIHE